MEDWSDRYRRAFDVLGRRLGPADALATGEIVAAEPRLGFRAPRSLVDYYRVAGRAGDYTSVFNRLLPPSRWSVEAGKLVFMEENQAVVIWGTEAADEGDDPPAFQAANAEPLAWHAVNPRCSIFLLVMLHWEATFGGAMPHASTAHAPADLVSALDRGWSFVGDVNGMRAYNRPGHAVCFLLWDEEWRVFAGASDVEGLSAIGADLGLQWETESA